MRQVCSKLNSLGVCYYSNGGTDGCDNDNYDGGGKNNKNNACENEKFAHLLSIARVATLTRSDQSKLVASGILRPSARVLMRGLCKSDTARGDSL
jgi:hypothetical protein